ncbi:MAG TPA: class I SAM-dependent methyltransferase [Negativicutes bacterium]|jgi:ubiquinone/menaquinone biosynthesis C-methylase UbiE
MTNKQELDSHRSAVTNYFSTNARFWEVIYDPNQAEIDRIFTDSITGRKRDVLECVDKHAGTKQLRILDIGCGPGIFMEELLRRGHYVVGMDMTEKMVREAYDNTQKKYSERAACVLGDIEYIPFKNNSFDLILCIGVLSYLQEEDKSAKEIARVIKKNGIFVTSNPNKLRMNILLDPYYYLIYGFDALKNRLFTHKASEKTSEKKVATVDSMMTFMKRFSYWQILNLFKKHNFIEIDTAGNGFGPLTIWKKEPIPVPISLGFSRCIEKLSKNPLFSVLRIFSNHMIVCMRKL